MSKVRFSMEVASTRELRLAPAVRGAKRVESFDNPGSLQD